MAKLNKKSVDVNQILSKPKETWCERFMHKALSNATVLAIFTAVVGRVKKCFGQENDAWNVIMGKVDETFQYSRKIVFIFVLFLMAVSFCVALFQKVFWWQVLCSALLFLSLFILPFLDVLNINDTMLNYVTLTYLCLFPCVFYYALYKGRKVTGKTAVCGIIFNIVILLLCAIFILCMSYI